MDEKEDFESGWYITFCCGNGGNGEIAEYKTTRDPDFDGLTDMIENHSDDGAGGVRHFAALRLARGERFMPGLGGAAYSNNPGILVWVDREIEKGFFSYKVSQTGLAETEYEKSLIRLTCWYVNLLNEKELVYAVCADCGASRVTLGEFKGKEAAYDAFEVLKNVLKDAYLTGFEKIYMFPVNDDTDIKLTYSFGSGEAKS